MKDPTVKNRPFQYPHAMSLEEYSKEVSKTIIWFEVFEKKQKQFANDGFKRRQWIEDNLFIKDEILQARYAHVLKMYVDKEILGETT